MRGKVIAVAPLLAPPSGYSHSSSITPLKLMSCITLAYWKTSTIPIPIGVFLIDQPPPRRHDHQPPHRREHRHRRGHLERHGRGRHLHRGHHRSPREPLPGTVPFHRRGRGSAPTLDPSRPSPPRRDPPPASAAPTA